MAFTVNDYHDLVRLLEEHPEWQTQLRRLLLDDDLTRLPQTVQELVQAQARTEARVNDLAQRVTDLAEAQARTEARVNELAQAQARTETQLQSLEAAVQQLTQAVEKLAEVQIPMARDVSVLKDYALEARYRSHAGAYFGRWLRRARAVDLSDLAAVMEAHDNGALSNEDWDYLQALDVAVRGLVGQGDQAQEVLLALEVSWVIDSDDVERAQRRAALLERLGYRAIGAVGGDVVLSEADERAHTLGVALALQGRMLYWPPVDIAGGTQTA